MTNNAIKNLMNDIICLAETNSESWNAYESKRNSIILKVFLKDIIVFGGFPATVASTVLESLRFCNDIYIARCSEKQARILAEAALKRKIRFVCPKI